MIKNELRKKYLEIRNNIKNRDIKDHQIMEEILENQNIKSSSLILTYVSFNGEVDTFEIMKELIKYKRIAVPKIENGGMNFYFINSLDDLKVGTYDILEPTTEKRVQDFFNSTCLVPGICFNQKGYRVGYGKGYYDRFLENYPGYTIGLTYLECLNEVDFQDSHDIKVKRIIYK